MKKVLFILLFVLFLVGCDNEEAQAEVDGEAKNLEEIKIAISESEEELESLEEKINESKTTLETLDSNIDEAENELEEAQEQYASEPDEPIEVEAGEFYFGEDIEPGRYKVEMQEGYSGNVRVESPEGDLVMAKSIGGDGQYSVESYTFSASLGDIIKPRAPILLHPVE